MPDDLPAAACLRRTGVDHDRGALRPWARNAALRGAISLPGEAVRDLFVFLAWNCAVFGVGFAAGWTVCRRRLRRRAKLGRSQP
jgi:hypothetical protein